MHGFGFFDGMPAFAAVFFLFIFGFMAFAIISMIMTAAKNARSPIITVNATIVTKRTEVSSSHHADANGVNHESSSTYYHVTFETEHGERMELSVSGRMYGLMVEGDQGKLTYQGTWFKDFQRDRLL